MTSGPGVLLYYFGFPHYRREILIELRKKIGSRLDIVSGTSTRSSVATLSPAELSDLKLVPTVRLGPFTWDKNVVTQAVDKRTGTVILGPATTSLSTWCILIARRLLRRPTYLWGQCGRPGDRSIKRLLQEAMNILATGLLVYGESEARAAQELGRPIRKIHVVYNATESNEDALTRSTEDLVIQRLRQSVARAVDDDDIRLLYIGRLVPFKRIDSLLDAARLLSQRHRRVSVDVVGGGDDIDRLSTKYPDANFTFHGWIYSGEQRDELLNRASAVVSPWHIGLLAIDALRAGVPVLFPDNPMNASEVESLTPGVNSLSFTAGDPESLAKTVDDWIRMSQTIDPTQFLDVRSKSLGIWTPEHVATRIAEVISERT